jgi:hypothetical protein
MLETLVTDWLPLSEAANRLGAPESRLRQWLRERRLLAARRGSPPTLCVPAAFLRDGELLPGLAGTLTLLADAGFTDDEALRWLFTADPSLPGRPVDALAEGRPREVHRRAQAAAF